MTPSILRARPGRIVLKTRRYAEMVAWYTLVLRARTLAVTPTLTWLLWGDSAHQLAIIDMPQLADADRSTAGIAHLGIAYDNEMMLLQEWHRLRDKNIEPYWSIDYGYCVSLYFRDLDGQSIELQTWRCTDPTEQLVFINCENSEQPAGVEFDPIVRAHELGMDLPDYSCEAQ
jgi:catechol-2,3-dioxygenase